MSDLFPGSHRRPITLTCGSQTNWAESNKEPCLQGVRATSLSLQKLPISLTVFLVNKMKCIKVTGSGPGKPEQRKISTFVGHITLREIQQYPLSGSGGLALTRWSLIGLIAQPGPHSGTVTQLWATADGATARGRLRGVTEPQLTKKHRLSLCNDKLLCVKRWTYCRGGLVPNN